MTARCAEKGSAKIGRAKVRAKGWGFAQKTYWFDCPRAQDNSKHGLFFFVCFVFFNLPAFSTTIRAHLGLPGSPFRKSITMEESSRGKSILREFCVLEGGPFLCRSYMDYIYWRAEKSGWTIHIAHCTLNDDGLLPLLPPIDRTMMIIYRSIIHPCPKWPACSVLIGLYPRRPSLCP